jgi:N-carbamoylputrescine amidase
MVCTADVESNIHNAMQRIRDAASKGANIICLQELFSNLYFCDTENYDNFALAEKIPGHTTQKLQELAAELGIVIIASLFEKRADGLFHNTTAVFDADGSLAGKYRKNHIPDDPGFYEKFYFAPGDTGYGVFKTRYANVGILICWDQWYPEAARITALMGAEIIFYPTAIGWALKQPDAVNAEQHNACRLFNVRMPSPTVYLWYRSTVPAWKGMSGSGAVLLSAIRSEKFCTRHRTIRRRWQ